MIEQYMMLELASPSCWAEAYLNGVPISRAGPQTPILEAQPVNHLVVGGQNVLELLMEPGPTPSRAFETSGERISDGKLKGSLKLALYPEGAFPEDPGVTELAQISWAPPAGERFQTPVRQSASFSLPLWAPRWSWQSAPALALTETVVRSVHQLLMYLSANLAQKNPEPFIQYAHTRFQEVAAAFGRGVQDEIREFREEFQSIAAEPDWQMGPVRLETLDLRLCGDGRLIECVDRDWLPVLRTVRQEDGLIRLRYPIFLAQVGGNWQIVR